MPGPRLFPNPLSSDDVDKLNHKWMVLALLVLSLVAFIIPLHPSYQGEGHGNDPVTVIPQPTQSAKTKSVSADVACWCPSDFTSSMVRYSNAFCRNSFLSALAGNNESETIIRSSQKSDSVPSQPNLPPRAVDATEMYQEYLDKANKSEEGRAERDYIASRVQSMVTFQTPLMLLVIAAILVAPQVVWALLSDCCSPFNLAQVLTSASHVSAMDAASRTQAYEELSSSLTPGIQSSSKAASIMYLIKKVLALVTVIVLLLVVTKHALPRIQELDQRVDNVGPTIITVVGTSSANYQGTDTNFPQEVFECKIPIKLLTNTQIFRIQCVSAAPDQSEEIEAPKQPLMVSAAKPLSSEKNLLEFESCIFHTVTAVLAILVVANVLSLLGWLYKLVSTSSRNAVRLSGNAAMDTVLVVQMARINCGPHVAHRLAQGSAEFSKVETNEMVNTAKEIEEG